jgi:hypothetical protein
LESILSTAGYPTQYAKVTATDTSEKISQLTENIFYSKDEVVHFYGNWFKANVFTQVTAAAVPGLYTVIEDGTNGNSLAKDWDQIPATTAFETSDTIYIGKYEENTDGLLAHQNEGLTYGNVFGRPAIFSPDGLTWQYSIDRYYQWLSAILSNPRIHRVLVRIRPTDLPLAFDRPIYWNQAYWYLVSVQDYTPMSGENTVCVLAQIPDYPTS